MISPATVRLMGLLVIVVVVAGCGVDEDTTPDSQTEPAVAALTMSDVVVLRAEQKRMHDEVLAFLDGAHPGDVENELAIDEVQQAVTSVYEAYAPILEMLRAIERGDDDAARQAQHAALEGLQSAQRHLDLARDAEEQE